MRITSGVRVKIGWDKALTQKPVIMRASHILRGDCKNCISHSLPWRETFGGEGDHGCLTQTSLTSALFYATRNYSKVSVYIWEKIPLKLEGDAIEPEGRLACSNRYIPTYGVDYEETFSPVADIRAIRILISIAAFYDYEIWQMDVKTAFLNGYLDEYIYMVQPEGFVDPKYPRKVCKLQRSIYGLKQASRSWNKRFDEEIKKFGFAQNLDEPCVYQKDSGSNVTFLILYVDDIIIMGNHIPSLHSVRIILESVLL
ncbi:retrotransposon protein, putative, ty1-copia subclass [Tanacetum coccineum]